MYVRPHDPHRWINIGDVELEVFYVVSPSAFGEVGGYMNTVKDWQQVQPAEGSAAPAEAWPERLDGPPGGL